MAKSPTKTRQSGSNALAEGQRRQAEAVAFQEALEGATPTPTQEENDKAKLGILEGELGDSGAPSEDQLRDAQLEIERRQRAEAAGKGATYNTRDAKAE